SLHIFLTLPLTYTVSLHFLFHDPPTTEIYTLSLHDALPISRCRLRARSVPLHGLGRQERLGQDRQGQSLERGNREGSPRDARRVDRKSTRLNSSHVKISYAVFCLKKKKKKKKTQTQNTMIIK